MSRQTVSKVSCDKNGVPIWDFGLEVSKGSIEHYTSINKYGSSPAVGTSEEGVWHYGGDINWIVTPTILQVSSSSAADDAGGTGALTMVLEGLDADYNALTETVTLDGQAQVATTGTYLRIHRAYIVDVGTGGANAGDLYIYTGAATAGVPDTATQVYSTISADHGQTSQAFYTIPAEFTGFLISGYGVAAAGKTVDVEVFFRLEGKGWRMLHEFSLNNDTYTQHYAVPPQIPEKSDIMVVSSVDTGTARVSAGFNIVLIANHALR